MEAQRASLLSNSGYVDLMVGIMVKPLQPHGQAKISPTLPPLCSESYYELFPLNPPDTYCLSSPTLLSPLPLVFSTLPSLLFSSSHSPSHLLSLQYSSQLAVVPRTSPPSSNRMPRSYWPLSLMGCMRTSTGKKERAPLFLFLGNVTPPTSCAQKYRACQTNTPPLFWFLDWTL